MYLVGARFGDFESANAALVELRDRVAVAPHDVGVRQLGSLRYERPARGHVVAGRFEPDDVAAVIAILERHGGEIVFRRADWRLVPRAPSSRGGGSGARCQRLSRLRT
jgi:hypothetical protein